MVRFDDVSLRALRAIDLHVPAGARALIVVPDGERRRDLFSLLGGLASPESGRVSLFGESLYDLPEPVRTALYRRVGVVPVNGGLISNLKVWENILLPVAYHAGRVAQDAEAAVLQLFRKLGMANGDTTALMGKLPDGLSATARRYVALVRALITDVELMIYDDVFAGLGRDAVERVCDVTRTHHGARTGRTSVFLTGDEAHARHLQPDLAITVD